MYLYNSYMDLTVHHKPQTKTYIPMGISYIKYSYVFSILFRAYVQIGYFIRICVLPNITKYEEIVWKMIYGSIASDFK